MQYINDLNAANVLRQLWEKLPRYLRSKWKERVNKIRSNNQQVPSFNDFSPFVSQQADFVTYPVYSEESISRSVDTVDKHHKQNERKPKRGRRTNFATDLLTKKAIGGNSFHVSLALCPKAHPLDECAEFLKKPLEDRRELIKEKGLCFGCHSPENVAKLCRSKGPVRPVIKDTQRHFMTTAGGEKERTPSIRNQKWERKTKPSMHAVCNVTEGGDVPITMGIVPIYGCTTRTI